MRRVIAAALSAVVLTGTGAAWWAAPASAHPPDPDQAGIDVADIPYVCTYLRANNHDSWVVAVMARNRLGATGSVEALHEFISEIDISGVCD